MSDPVTILDFWLGEIGPDGWYVASDALDAKIALEFGDLWQAAFEGGLDHWVDGPAGSLAFLLLTDQFSRNMFRGQAKAFATDPAALTAAHKAIAQGWDMEVPEPERQFFYLPFEHSEDPADQALGLGYISERMSNESTALHARAHQEIIRRFGRFPFRNAALGRDSTAQEQTFLQEGGYGAVLRALQS
ncbi:MAG: hypothetical protein ACJASV_003008 [Pseudorhodobacter sp.]|jgi:uncharacterized protein (DUF924 family)